MISVILPTVFRPTLKAAIESLSNTVGEHKVELLLIYDDYVTDFDETKNNARVRYIKNMGLGPLSAWNTGLKYSEGDIIFPYGDDGLCHEGWLDYALETHQNVLQGYGAVGLNDGAYNGNMQTVTTFLYDRNFIKNELGGVIAFPVYKYYCVDMEIQERAKRIGKLVWDERAIVEHMHSAHGKRPLDETDIYKQKWMESDNELFRQRKEKGFPNNFEAVI